MLQTTKIKPLSKSNFLTTIIPLLESATLNEELKTNTNIPPLESTLTKELKTTTNIPLLELLSTTRDLQTNKTTTFQSITLDKINQISTQEDDKAAINKNIKTIKKLNETFLNISTTNKPIYSTISTTKNTKELLSKVTPFTKIITALESEKTTDSIKTYFKQNFETTTATMLIKQTPNDGLLTNFTKGSDLLTKTTFKNTITNNTNELKLTTILPISETTQTLSSEFKLKVANLLNKLKEELSKLRKMSQSNTLFTKLNNNITLNQNASESSDKKPLIIFKDLNQQKSPEYEKARVLISNLKNKLEELKKQSNNKILEINSMENSTGTLNNIKTSTNQLHNNSSLLKTTIINNQNTKTLTLLSATKTNFMNNKTDSLTNQINLTTLTKNESKIIQTTPLSILADVTQIENRLVNEFNKTKENINIDETDLESTELTTKKIINELKTKNSNEQSLIIDGEPKEISTIKVTSLFNTTQDLTLINEKTTTIPSITETFNIDLSESSFKEIGETVITNYPKHTTIKISTKNWKIEDSDFAFVTEAPEISTINKSTLEITNKVPSSTVTSLTTEKIKKTTSFKVQPIKQENIFNIGSETPNAISFFIPKKQINDKKQININHEQISTLTTLQQDLFTALFPTFKATTQPSIQRLFKQITFDESQQKTRILLLPPTVQNSIDSGPTKLNIQNNQEEKIQLINEQQQKNSEKEQSEKQKLLIEQIRLQEQQKIQAEQRIKEQEKLRREKIEQQEQLFEEDKKLKTQNETIQKHLNNGKNAKSENEQTNIKASDGDLANRLEQVTILTKFLVIN